MGLCVDVMSGVWYSCWGPKAERGLSGRRTGSSILQYMVSVSHDVAKKGKNMVGEPQLIK